MTVRETFNRPDVLHPLIPRNTNTGVPGFLATSTLFDLLSEDTGWCDVIRRHAIAALSSYEEGFEINSNFADPALLGSSRLHSLHKALSMRCEKQERELQKLRRELAEVHRLQGSRLGAALLDPLSRKILEALGSASDPVNLCDLRDITVDSEDRTFWLSIAKLMAGDLIVLDDCSRMVFPSPLGYSVLKGQF